MIITMFCYFRLISISLLLSLSLSSSLSLTFSLLFETLPARPLQATSQVFALIPVGSQQHGRQRGHLVNVLPRYLFIYMPWSGLILAV